MKQIVITGLDGCGKDTQIYELWRHLIINKITSVGMIKHPGFTYFGKQIKEAVFENEDGNDLANRLAFWAEFIESYNCAKISNYDVVIYNRHPLFDNIAYGVPMGTPKETLFGFNSSILKCNAITYPDLVICLDADIETCVDRILKRGGEISVVEQRGIDYFKQVKKEFLSLASIMPNYYVIDSNKEREDVFDEIVKIVEEKLNIEFKMKMARD